MAGKRERFSDGCTVHVNRRHRDLLGCCALKVLQHLLVRVGVVVAVPVVVGVSVPMALAVLMGVVVGVSILMPVVGMIVPVSLVMAISVVVAFVRVLVLVNGGMVVLVVVTQAPVDFSSIVAVVQLTSLLVFLFLLL